MVRDAQLDKNIFRFRDAEGDRAVDPFRVMRKLQHNGKFDLKTYADLADAGQEPEASEFYALLHEAFGSKPFDEKDNSGTTDMEMADIFAAFCGYLEKVKKNSSLGLTLLQPTVSESLPNQEPQNPVTSAPSDSTSARTESVDVGNGV